MEKWLIKDDSHLFNSSITAANDSEYSDTPDSELWVRQKAPGDCLLFD